MIPKSSRFINVFVLSLSVAMIRARQFIEETLYVASWFQKGKNPSWRGSMAADTGMGLEQEAERSTFKCRHEARKVNAKWSEVKNPQYPLPSDTFPPAKPSFLDLPKLPPTGHQTFKCSSL